MHPTCLDHGEGGKSLCSSLHEDGDFMFFFVLSGGKLPSLPNQSMGNGSFFAVSARLSPRPTADTAGVCTAGVLKALTDLFSGPDVTGEGGARSNSSKAVQLGV